MTDNILASSLARAERQFCDKTAIIHGERELTFAEVGEASSRLASSLTQELGIPTGARVAILLPNRPELTIVDWALIRAGLVRVPLNPRLAPAEIEYMLNDSGAEVLVYDDDCAEVAAKMQATVPTLKYSIGLGKVVPGALSWSDVLAKGEPDNFQMATELDDPYMILYTSGTTGRPKGATTTLRSRWFTIFTSAANENFVEESDVMLHVASLGHGSGTKVINHYVKGATNIYLPKFTVESFCEAVQRHGVTTTWVVPTILGMLLDYPDRSRYDLSSLQTMVYGGAPMPVERLKEALAIFGPIFVQVFGLSETPHPIMSMGKTDHISGESEQRDERLASAGRPSLGVEVRLVAEDGQDAKVGEIGEIVVRGDNVMVGYWNNPEATAESIKDGWFFTGDLAIASPDGYIAIVDRMKDMIISGGYNVYPREIEEVLYAHGSVRECAVIGVPDAKWGEAVKAVVSLKNGAGTTPEELLEHCREWLAGYKKPQTIELMDDLPKSPNGKILKRELKKKYWDNQQRNI